MPDNEINHKPQPDEGQWHEAISGIMNELITVKRELQQKNAELEEALAQVKTLEGLLPICASCKNVRDDKGYWQTVESFVSSHSDATFTHGLCPACVRKLYPEYADEVLKETGDDKGGDNPPPSIN
jgi:DNA repair exonuclease SbcCD ATPase subunit